MRPNNCTSMVITMKDASSCIKSPCFGAACLSCIRGNPVCDQTQREGRFNCQLLRSSAEQHNSADSYLTMRLCAARM